MKLPEIKEIILKSIKKDRYEKYLELMPDLKSEKNEKLIAAILTVTASIILAVFAINPTISTIVSLQKQVDDNKAYEAKLQEKINNLALLDQQYQILQNDLPFVFDAVPKTAEIATLAGTLQALTTSSNAVKLTKLQTLQVGLSKESLAKASYSSYGFTLAAQGNYQDLISLMDRLISFQRILTIDTVSINKSISTTETTLQINLAGNAYFKP